LASNNSYVVLNSQIENIPALAQNQTYYVADLICPCPARISGSLKTCQNQNIDGLVKASWSGGFYYQHTTNSNFNTPCMASSPVTIDAFANYNSSYYSGTTSCTSPAAGNTVNVGDIILCTPAILPNYLLINGGPFNNVLFDFTTSPSRAQTINPGLLISYDYGISSPFSTTDFRIQTSIISPGNNPWSYTTYSYVGVNITDSQHYYTIGFFGLGTTGITNLTYVGSTGDHVRGDFSGTANCGQDSSSSYPVTISGAFDVIRH
jgi:hypothetical protein